MGAISKDFAARINLKKFAAYIKDEHGLRGGGSLTTIQGGGAKLKENFEEDILNWIKRQ